MKRVKRKLAGLGVLLAFTAVCCAGPLNAAMSATTIAAAAQEQRSAVTGSAAGIPDRMFAAYQTGAGQVTDYVPSCKGMRWQVLAGIAAIESHHAIGHSIAPNGDITPHILGPRLDGSGAGGNTTPIFDTDHGAWDGDATYDRAVGPFQFLPSTFRGDGKDGNRDTAVDPHNADDAALSAAIYLCGSGRDLTDREQLSQAIYGYNHSAAYVADVLANIDRYDTLGATPAVPGAVTGSVRTVLAAALRQMGVPYSWGGGTPQGPSPGVCCSPGGQDGTTVTGFDCSGLTLYAFAQAGISLPRLAADQASRGTRIPVSAGTTALQPGDLVFYAYAPGEDSTIHHVGIYLGDGQLINAARPGTVVRVEPVTAQPGYAGGARLL